MARKVFITSDMSVDEKVIDVAEKDPVAGLMWPWLLLAFDDWGRAESNPKSLKARIFPAFPNVTADTVEAALQLYNSVGLLTLYEVDGKRFMAITPLAKWYKHQTHMKRTDRRPGKDKLQSNYPAPPGESEDSPENPRGELRGILGVSGSPQFPVPSPSPSPSPSYTSLRDGGEATSPAGTHTPEQPNEQVAGSESLTETPTNAQPQRRVHRYSADAKGVADRLKSDLVGRGAVLPRDWHLRSYAVAQRMLNAGITAHEIDEAREWAWSDPWWSQHLDSMATLQKLVNQRRLGKVGPQARDRPPARDSPFNDERMSAWYREAFSQYEQGGKDRAGASGPGGGTGSSSRGPVQSGSGG